MNSGAYPISSQQNVDETDFIAGQRDRIRANVDLGQEKAKAEKNQIGMKFILSVLLIVNCFIASGQPQKRQHDIIVYFFSGFDDTVDVYLNKNKIKNKLNVNEHYFSRHVVLNVQKDNNDIVIRSKERSLKIKATKCLSKNITYIYIYYSWNYIISEKPLYDE